MSDATHTVRLHRVLRAPAERVYRAFLDPDAMAKWLPPHGFTGTVHQSDARVGGSYRMSFTNFSSGTTHSFGGTSGSSTRTNSRLRTCPGRCTSRSRYARSPVARIWPSCRKACQRRFPSRCAISDGRSRCGNWPTSSKRRFPTARSAAAQRWLAYVCPGGCSEQSGGKPCHRILYARVYLCRPYAEPLPVT